MGKSGNLRGSCGSCLITSSQAPAKPDPFDANMRECSKNPSQNWKCTTWKQKCGNKENLELVEGEGCLNEDGIQ